jgi:L-histidine N-alpha-methyltransferase
MVRDSVQVNPTSMTSTITVAIHSSQWPESVQRDLIQSLESRKLNHKFLYDSVRQTQKWLALHRACSPSQTDPDCQGIYDASFAAVAAACAGSTHLHLISLGCGGGQKEARLLRLLSGKNRLLAYTPCDVSGPMVLVAYQAALAVLQPEDCHPLVCDLPATNDLRELLDAAAGSQASRLVTFFGMIPNFEPAIILPRLADAVRRDDRLLFSANLAPGMDYLAGIQKVLPLYDNDLTRDWLLSFLVDLGVEPNAGELRFVIEDCPSGNDLKRIAAYFDFQKHSRIGIGEKSLQFRTGDSLRLFFSYRHTPQRIRDLLGQYGFQVLEQWVTRSEEEGVFLCQRKAL